jgi:hypothetical protein
MSSKQQIGRLVLSSRNTYKVNKKTARQCLILSDTMDNILINTSKDFESRDSYVLVDINKKELVDNYGKIGNEQDDLNIYHHLYTYFWTSNSKLYKHLKNFNFNYDICKDRIPYTKQVITVDPFGSTDLDDGFTINFFKSNEKNMSNIATDPQIPYDKDLENIEDIVELDIHISDPMSYFDLNNLDVLEIFKEMTTRISTCYIPVDKKIKHLLPEINIGGINLLELSTLIGTNKRSITFSFKINLLTNKIDLLIKKTLLTNILNTTYEEYDEIINKNKEYKEKLISLCKFMVRNLNCNLDVENLDIDKNISHKLIEIFMIWTNYYAGDYLYNKKNKMMVRTQLNFLESDIKKEMKTEDNVEKIIPEYAKTFLNLGAKYEFVVEKSIREYLHYSLGIKNYCQVTSPMRRVIDMVNHLLLHDIDEIMSIENYDNFIRLINIDTINSKIKKYKKLSNAYDIILHLKITNKFRGCVFSILNSNKMLLVLYDEINDFKKIVKVAIPVEYYHKLTQFDEINLELFYDPYKFKSKSLPFSIKIIE